MTTTRYCTNCGAPVAVGNRFCGRCGQAVQAPSLAVRGPQPQIPGQAPVRQPPAPPTEPILGVVAVGKPKGLMGMRHDSYNMVVTPRRLIFAYVSPQLMKAAMEQARAEARRKGKGFLGQWGAQLAWLGVVQRQYRMMSVDAILRQYQGSFAVPNQRIHRVRYKRNHDQERGQTNAELILRTADGKLRFKLLTGNVRQVKRLLQRALGGVA